MKKLLLAFVLLRMAAAAWCAPVVPVDPALPRFIPSKLDASGERHVIGSDAMETVVARWVAIFRKAHPNLSFTYEIEKNFNSIGLIADGKVLFAPLGRSIYKTEYLDFIEKAGYVPTSIRASMCTYYGGPNKDWPHPHAVFVNHANPLTKLTLTQVDAIFSKTRRRGYPTEITKWGQLGLGGDWTNQAIVLYGVNGGQGNRGPGVFFRERALASGDIKEVHGAPSEEFVVPMIAADRYGIGFTGLPFETQAVRHLALAENEGGRYSDASLADVAAGKYPLSRFTFFHFDRPPGMPIDPVLKEMIRVALSREGQEAASEEGYVPLSAAEVRKELVKLE